MYCRAARGAEDEGEASNSPRGERDSVGGRKEIGRANGSVRERRRSNLGGRMRVEIPPHQQQQHDPSKVTCEPQLVDRLGTGSEGAGCSI